MRLTILFTGFILNLSLICYPGQAMLQEGGREAGGVSAGPSHIATISSNSCEDAISEEAMARVDQAWVHYEQAKSTFDAWRLQKERREEDHIRVSGIQARLFLETAMANGAKKDPLLPIPVSRDLRSCSPVRDWDTLTIPSQKESAAQAVLQAIVQILGNSSGELLEWKDMLKRVDAREEKVHRSVEAILRQKTENYWQLENQIRAEVERALDTLKKLIPLDRIRPNPKDKSQREQAEHGYREHAKEKMESIKRKLIEEYLEEINPLLDTLGKLKILRDKVCGIAGIVNTKASETEAQLQGNESILSSLRNPFERRA